MSTHYTHKICFTVTKKFYAQSRISDKHNIDSSLYNIITSVKDKDVAKHRVQEHYTENTLFIPILQITIIYIHLITCCDLHVEKFPSTKLKPVLKKQDGYNQSHSSNVRRA
jgi:hypothetical protein